MPPGRPRGPSLNVVRPFPTVVTPTVGCPRASNTHRTDAFSTGQLSGAFLSHTPRSTESRLPPDTDAPDKFSCPVLTVQHRSVRVYHRTDGTCHRTCPVPSVRCSLLLCCSRPRARLHRTRATGQNTSVRCSVRCTEMCVSAFRTSPNPASQARREGEGYPTPLHLSNSTSLANVPTPQRVDHHVHVC